MSPARPLLVVCSAAALLLALSAASCRRPWEPPAAFASLASGLRHPEASVRAAAAARLAELWPERRVLPMLVQALTDEDDGVAQAAALSLVRIGRPGIPRLVEGVRRCYLGGRTARAWQLAGMSLELGPEAGAALQSLAAEQQGK